jgi:hypothetical protein
MVIGQPKYAAKLRKVDTGTLFEGEFMGSLAHGHGKIQYANGYTYDGEWKEDARHGRGRETYGDGAWCECVYVEGTLRSGKYVTNKSMYEGGMALLERVPTYHGYGVFIDHANQLRYEGE